MNFSRPEVKVWFVATLCFPEARHSRRERSCSGVEERSEIIVFLLCMSVAMVFSLPRTSPIRRETGAYDPGDDDPDDRDRGGIAYGKWQQQHSHRISAAFPVETRNVCQYSPLPMGFTYHHLNDPELRERMLELWRVENRELVSSGLRQDCYGADLIDAGWQAWDNVMPEALANHDDDWLVDQMLDPTFWRSHRPRKLKSGGYSQSRVNPSWASKLLCLGEFNIAYVRGLSEVLLSRGEKECVVYRADAAAEPRCECTAWEEQRFPLEDIVNGHRARYWPPNSFNPGAFSVPSGFNCHHSIRAAGL